MSITQETLPSAGADAPSKKKKREPKPASAVPDHPDAVLSPEQWAELNQFSIATGRRILASGDGPTVTVLSERRIGITRRHNREWQDRRSRPAT